MPASSSASISKEVATGRRMKGRDRFIARRPSACALVARTARLALLRTRRCVPVHAQLAFERRLVGRDASRFAGAEEAARGIDRAGRADGEHQNRQDEGEQDSHAAPSSRGA